MPVLLAGLDEDAVTGISPYWDPAAPVRPLDDPPVTFLGLAGAVVDHRLTMGSRIPADARGTGRPPLFPSVADATGVRAVLSATRVGRFRCDLVAYFARPRPAGSARFWEWGTRLARTLDGSGWRWVAGPAADPTVEADLGPWLSSGRLAWIAPFDMGVELRSGPDGCPWITSGR